jgi:hypothetical protein
MRKRAVSLCKLRALICLGTKKMTTPRDIYLSSSDGATRFIT